MVTNNMYFGVFGEGRMDGHECDITVGMSGWFGRTALFPLIFIQASTCSFPFLGLLLGGFSLFFAVHYCYGI
jgi:hypothetical protein